MSNPEVSREDLVQNIRRLTRIILDRLETGTQEKMIDQAQARMLSSIALRSMKLWRDVYTSPRITGRIVQGVTKIENELDSESK